MKNLNKEKIIGVIGGMGPEAGAYLLSKIIEETKAKCDRDHLEVYLASDTKIPDRSQYILNKIDAENPKGYIEKSLNSLSNLGATVIGMACNTAHSVEVSGDLFSSSKSYKFISMIKAVKHHIIDNYKPDIKVALLATSGTYFSRVYDNAFDDRKLIKPDADDIKLLQETIYKIKSGIDFDSKTVILDITKKLQVKGAEIVILGCTELPLVVRNGDLPIEFLNSSRILARALIFEAAPWKLKNYSFNYNNLDAAKTNSFHSDLDRINQKIISLLVSKNSFYKDSYKKQGLVGILLRSLDKIHRAINITTNKIEITSSETLEDTIKDLIGYCFLYLKELESCDEGLDK